MLAKKRKNHVTLTFEYDLRI